MGGSANWYRFGSGFFNSFTQANFGVQYKWKMFEVNRGDHEKTGCTSQTERCREILCSSEGMHYVSGLRGNGGRIL